jgi:hypothetical protein
MVRASLALVSIALSLVARALLNVGSLIRAANLDWAEKASSPTELRKLEADDAQANFFYYVVLEALPSLAVLIAVGEQVAGTTFNAEGVVPWTLRVDEGELTLGSLIGEGGFGVVVAGDWRGQKVTLLRLTQATHGPLDAIYPIRALFSLRRVHCVWYGAGRCQAAQDGRA